MSVITKYDKNLHIYVGYSHEKKICDKTIIEEYILSLNVAETMSTGSSKAICIILYMRYIKK